MEYCEWFNKQDKVLKIVLLIPIWGWIFSLLYRIFDFAEHKDTATLICCILFIVPFVGFVVNVIDIVTVAIDDKISFFVHGGENFGINGTVDSNNENKEEEKTDAKDNVVDAEVTEVKEESEEKKDE